MCGLHDDNTTHCKVHVIGLVDPLFAKLENVSHNLNDFVKKKERKQILGTKSFQMAVCRSQTRINLGVLDMKMFENRRVKYITIAGCVLRRSVPGQLAYKHKHPTK